MSKQTPKQIEAIEIESFFTEETDGTITYCWRPLSENKPYSWYTRKTTYKKLPYIKMEQPHEKGKDNQEKLYALKIGYNVPTIVYELTPKEIVSMEYATMEDIISKLKELGISKVVTDAAMPRENNLLNEEGIMPMPIRSSLL